MLILKSEFSNDISFSAKGVLYTLANYPQYDCSTIEQLTELSHDTAENVSSAIKELVSLGYVLKNEDRYSFNKRLSKNMKEV